MARVDVLTTIWSVKLQRYLHTNPNQKRKTLVLNHL